MFLVCHARGFSRVEIDRIQRLKRLGLMSGLCVRLLDSDVKDNDNSETQTASLNYYGT